MKKFYFGVSIIFLGLFSCSKDGLTEKKDEQSVSKDYSFNIEFVPVGTNENDSVELILQDLNGDF